MTEWIGAAIFVVGAIFVAGKIISALEAKQNQTRLDVNGIGNKLRELEKTTAVRHHNVSLAIMAQVDDRKERFEIANLLKRED